MNYYFICHQEQEIKGPIVTSNSCSMLHPFDFAKRYKSIILFWRGITKEEYELFASLHRKDLVPLQETTESLVFKSKDGRTIVVTDPALIALFEREPRDPCLYCLKDHLDYACDEQIEFIKQKRS